MDEEIFKITPDRERARDLLNMAKDRLSLFDKIPDRPYKLVEEYYEIIKELLTAVMYIDGHKTLSHVALIHYFEDKYSLLDETQIITIDNLRKIRHGIGYYGQQVSSDFILNNGAAIKRIIGILLKFVEKKLK